MKKIGKILVLLLLLGIFVGAGITVFINHEKEEKNKSKKKTEINYKITRKNNKYNISNSEGKLLNKTISNIFYNGKIVYIFLSDEENTTLLKYELKTESVEVVYEENKELLGEIKRLGNNYIINNQIYDKNFKQVKEYNINENEEMLYPNLKNKVIKRDGKIIIVSQEKEEETEVVVDDENKQYELFKISDNSEIIVLKRIEKDKTKFSYIKDNKINETDIELKEGKEYSLIGNKYILEKEQKEKNIKYNIYDIETYEKIYTNETEEARFYNTKLLYKKDGKLVLKDYVNQEENTIVPKETEVQDFIVPSDNYTLLIKYNDTNNVFYIYYL